MAVEAPVEGSVEDGDGADELEEICDGGVLKAEYQIAGLALPQQHHLAPRLDLYTRWKQSICRTTGC